MELINEYFKNVEFIKVGNKDNYSVYAAKFKNMTMSDKKDYVLLFVPSHLGILSKSTIDKLHWVNIQTRQLNQSTYPMLNNNNGFTWNYSKDIPNPVFNIVERSFKTSVYESPLLPDIKLELIHDPMKKTIYQYYSKMTLLAALSTMNCSITIQN